MNKLVFKPRACNPDGKLYSLAHLLSYVCFLCSQRSLTFLLLFVLCIFIFFTLNIEGILTNTQYLCLEQK